MTIRTTTHIRPVYRMTDRELLEEYEAMRVLKNPISREMSRMRHLFIAITSPTRRSR